MSQKSKLRRKQRNQYYRDDEPQGHRYGDAAEYFEQMRLQWEKNKKSPREG